MLTEIAVSGFRTLEDVTIPLAPGITVLVGANNSGKTNVLRLLEKLPALVQWGSQSRISVRARYGALDIEHGYSPATQEERIIVVGGDAEAVEARRTPERWTRTRRGTREEEGRGPNVSVFDLVQARELRETYAGIQVCDLVVPSLRGPAQIHANPTLRTDGLDIAAVLDVARDTQPDVFQRISEDVRACAPEIAQLVFPPGDQPGTKILGVQERNGRVFRAPEVSDGVLLLIALTTLAWLGLGKKPTILGIEEPDRGIHPRRIRDVVDQLRRLAARGTQIVVTTHSPILLDEFRDEPESILLLDRNERGTRITRLADHPDWKSGLFPNEPLGDLWYSGLLGGVPQRAGG